MAAADQLSRVYAAYTCLDGNLATTPSVTGLYAEARQWRSIADDLAREWAQMTSLL